jgi:hypothetical protein
MIFLTILTLIGALAVGLAFKRVLGTSDSNDDSSNKLDVAVSPLLALTTLLLAFVLVQVFSSYNRAKLSAGDEAGKVMGEFRLFGLMKDDNAFAGQAALLCYTRAVIGLEWPRMAVSSMEIVPEVTQWGEELARVMGEMTRIPTAPPYSLILRIDNDRGDARRRRVSETQPAVPLPVTWLMLGLSALSIISIGATTLSTGARWLQRIALTLLCAVFGIIQMTILDIDSKYDGWIRIGPANLRMMEQVMEQQYSRRYPQRPLPCDSQGYRL